MAAQGNHPHRQWRNLLINQGFQVKYVLLFMSATFAMASLLGVLLFGVLHYQARQRLLAVGHSTAFDNTLAIVGTALALAILVAVAVGVWSLFVSHRICGPMFIMQRWLDDVAKGKLPYCRKLRKNDEFKQFQATLAGAVDSLRERGNRELRTLTDVLEITRDAAQNGGVIKPGGIEQIVDQLDELRGEITTFLGENDNAAATAGKSADAVAVTENAALTV